MEINVLRTNDSTLQVAEELKKKIKDRTALVAVIGLGYVGLPLAVENAKMGFYVSGIEQNPIRARKVNMSENYIIDVNEEDLENVVQTGKLKAYSDFDSLPAADVIIICVPTPLNTNLDPDISYITNVTFEIARHLRQGQLVVLESTTYPGTTQEVILPRLEATGLKVGQDFFLAFSPERVDPANNLYTARNMSKVVGGVTLICRDVACTFYMQMIQQVVPVSSPKVAEMTKVFENTYRAVNIALVNELMLLCEKMGLDIWEVVDAAATKPFGIQTFYPGPGVGGHCIPVDPHYLAWKAREYDFHTRFIELAGEINMKVSYYVVNRVIGALNKAQKCINGAKVFVLGVAYKKDVADLRGSPALRIIKQLLRNGAEVTYHDPLIPIMEPFDHGIFTVDSILLNERTLAEADCVLIVADHSNIDYDWVVQHSRLVVDTRNATKHVQNNREKIVKI